jgi:hypothetical protein
VFPSQAAAAQREFPLHALDQWPNGIRQGYVGVCLRLSFLLAIEPRVQSANGSALRGQRPGLDAGAASSAQPHPAPSPRCAERSRETAACVACQSRRRHLGSRENPQGAQGRSTSSSSPGVQTADRLWSPARIVQAWLHAGSFAGFRSPASSRLLWPPWGERSGRVQPLR